MCLAVLGKVISVSKDRAKADFSGITREVSITFTPHVKIGDYVMVHAGFAIQKVEKDDAEETLRLFKSL